VALSGIILLVGAPYENVATNIWQGSAYFYQVQQTFGDVPINQ
jgi:hypothetical protein